MRMMILAAVFLGSPAVASEQQFDLICNVETKLRINAKWVPSQRHYRIDLQDNRWCEGSCDGTNKIAEVTDMVITLAIQKKVLPDDIYVNHYVTRNDGKLSYYQSGGFSYEETRGMCEPAPFSGFPPPKQKF